MTLSPDNVEAVRRRLARIARACDDRDTAALAALLDSAVELYSQARSRTFVGSVEVAGYLTSADEPVRHFYSNSDITGTADAAQVVSDVLVVGVDRAIRTVARHRDEFRLEDGEWLLVARRSTGN